MNAYAIVNKAGRIVKERVTEGRPHRQLCIYSTRRAANYYRVRNTEKVAKLSITVK